MIMLLKCTYRCSSWVHLGIDHFSRPLSNPLGSEEVL